MVTETMKAVKRLKTWLFIASLAAGILGPAVVSAVNHSLDVRLQADSPRLALPDPTPTPPGSVSPPGCAPEVNQLVFDQLEAFTLPPEIDPAISTRIAELYNADQAARRFPGNDPALLAAEDVTRRIEMLGYIQNGQIQTPQDLISAAYIFQHGDCPEHFRLANRLAQIALQAGSPDAPWIVAATLDRYLMSLGEPQKYGTQYALIDGVYQLYPVDPSTTDEERALYNVPPLSQAMDPAAAGMHRSPTHKQWLASWWLTWIGSGFAALSAVIALFAVKPDARIGRLTLAFALLLYPISVWGHYSQIHALLQGSAQTTQQFWQMVNALAIIIWLIITSIILHRFRKIRVNKPA